MRATRGRYPFGTDTPIEGGKSASGDRHAIMVDKSTCVLYELYNARYRSGGRSTAGSGAIWNLGSNRLRPAGWTSADAAGLPMLPGLLRIDEVEKRGVVNHAIRFTAQRTRTRCIWPARHQAGESDSPSLPPMGARFRLKASFPIGRYRADTQVVLRAMKKYGLILAGQRLELVLPGSGTGGLAGRGPRSAEVDPGRRVRGGRRILSDDPPELRQGPRALLSDEA